MDHRFECTHCKRPIKAAEELLGTLVQCPFCTTLVKVPVPEIGVGSVIGGYKIDRLLGKGSMGQVYLAEQLSIHRKVALKVLSTDLGYDEEYQHRFTNEIRMLGKLAHPNIVSAFDSGVEQGRHYLAMLYVDGESLDRRLDERGTMPEKEVLQIVQKTAQALSYVWEEAKILHRDIKPDNIMIDKQGEVRLMDLGVCKQATQITNWTGAGLVVGTPHYMSPEQAQGTGDLDFRSDMFSLGTTAYELLTCKVPFDDESVMKVMSKIVTMQHVPLRRLDENISKDCEAIVDRMMQKDPEDRYPNWDALEKDIETVLAGGHVSRKRKTANRRPAERREAPRQIPSGQSQRQSNPAFLAFIAVTVIIILVVLFLLLRDM